MLMEKMNNLPVELYANIAKHMKSKDLLNLILTNGLLYDVLIDYNKIYDLPNKDYFTNLTYLASDLKIPEEVQW